MDRLLKRFNCAADADLMLCEARGFAYQKEMTKARVEYGAEYFKKVEAYDGTPIAKAVNAGRCEMLARNLPAGAAILDWGAGSCAFVRDALAAGFDAKGYDVMFQSVERLMNKGWMAKDPNMVDAVTMWDTIEHIDQPEQVLKSIRKGCHLFVSVPIFLDLTKIRESKHYRPGEHLYYWTLRGFVDWLALYGFRLLEHSSHEIEAGRESIMAFAFCRDLPDYFDHIAAYKEIHSTRHYGSSAAELHLDTVAEVVRSLKPRSILDYGCGRSDLASHFWRDGERTIERYDPAIPAFKKIPEGKFDLVFACDLMEHIPMTAVDRVLAEIKDKSLRVLFTISTKLARAKLPDGRNAHVTILSRAEWMRWLADYFGSVQELPSKWEHELVFLAGAKINVMKAAA